MAHLKGLDHLEERLPKEMVVRTRERKGHLEKEKRWYNPIQEKRHLAKEMSHRVNQKSLRTLTQWAHKGASNSNKLERALEKKPGHQQ